MKNYKVENESVKATEAKIVEIANADPILAKKMLTQFPDFNEEATPPRQDRSLTAGWYVSSAGSTLPYAPLSGRFIQKGHTPVSFQLAPSQRPKGAQLISGIGRSFCSGTAIRKSASTGTSARRQKSTRRNFRRKMV